jgi:hypothetical protein
MRKIRKLKRQVSRLLRLVLKTRWFGVLISLLFVIAKVLEIALAFLDTFSRLLS